MINLPYLNALNTNCEIFISVWISDHCLLNNNPCLKRYVQWRMASSGMLRHVALVRTDVSEELSASFIRVTRIGELGTTLDVTSNRRTLQRSHMANIPEDPILHNHLHENLKSYTDMCNVCTNFFNNKILLSSRYWGPFHGGGGTQNEADINSGRAVPPFLHMPSWHSA
jgi:hypothetical protein